MVLGIDKQHILLGLIRRHRERRALRAAIERAYIAFNRSNPRWTAALFDEHFVTQTVALWLHSPRDTGALTPYGLAGAWATQLSAQPSRREALRAECLPAAAEFLRLLREELPAAPATLATSTTLVPSHTPEGRNISAL